MLSLGIFQKFSFIIVQSILWHDNGSINPRRQSDKWWELRFWSWWWLLRQLTHKVNTIMNCKFHFTSECIYVFQILNHDGTSHFCFQILRIHNRPHIFFDLTDHTKIHWWGKGEQCVSLYTVQCTSHGIRVEQFLEENQLKGTQNREWKQYIECEQAWNIYIVRYKKGYMCNNVVMIAEKLVKREFHCSWQLNNRHN